MKSALRSLLVLALASSAIAATWSTRHFALARSMPEADSSVTSPEKVQLWFTQAPQEGSVTVRLVDADGDLIDTADPVRNADDPKLMEVAVDHALAPGAYTVAWRGIGDDGHVVRNEFGFSVTGEK